MSLLAPRPQGETHARDDGFMAEVTLARGRAVGAQGLYDVSFEGRPIDDAALGRLLAAHGDRIDALCLWNTPVSNEGLRYLARAPRLSRLELGNNPLRRATRKEPFRSPITDLGLEHLEGLPALKTLLLTDVGITDAGLSCLPAIPALESLRLAQTKVEGPGLATLKSMPRLKTLTLEGDAVSDQALEYLAGWPALETLAIVRTSVQGPGLTVVKSLPRLTTLVLDGGTIDDRALSYLAGAPRLRSLALRNAPITAASLAQFKTLPRLAELDLERCGLAEGDLIKLKQSLPRVQVRR
jgi:hypothetical protein